MRLLFAVAVVASAASRLDAETGLAREVQAVCRDAETWRDALRGSRLTEQLACAADAPEEGDAERTEPEEKAWSFDLTGYWTNPPKDEAYGSAILRADRGALHLEGRYNYEGIDTGSAWAGWTFTWSGAVELSLVPMAGVVFGHTQGVAPGLELDLTWKVLELYTEAEWAFDVGGRDESFFYMWTELTVSPKEWLGFGLVAQRTRVFDTAVDVDRGLLLRFHVRSVSVTGYVFDLDTDRPYVMVGVGISF
jgi:hypothetical protein